MKITCLAENTTSDPRFLAEHGLSLLIETDGTKLLFDMGQTDLFAENAKKMDIDLSAVDIAIISHGHYDHGGGLDTFMQINSTAPIYISQYAFEPHYNATGKYIGLDPTLNINDRLVFTKEKTVIGEGLTLFSCNSAEKKFNTATQGMTVMANNKTIPDDFRHEQYLLIEEKDKRVLISGCSHKGILDIAHWFSPDVLIGGFHFSKLPLDSTLTEYAKLLGSMGISYYTCHCTGTEQFNFMKPHIGSLFYLSTGETVTI